MADHCGHFLIDSRNLSAAHNGRKLTYAEELESKSRSSVQVVAFEASESLLQQQQKMKAIFLTCLFVVASVFAEGKLSSSTKFKQAG